MISVTGVSKSYANQVVVDGVSADIKEGGITSIIGPNGAGKSTLLSIMSRLLRMDAGSVSVDGLDVFATPGKELARKMAEVAAAKEEAEAVKKAHLATLEQISGLTQEQAKQYLLQSVEDEVRHEAAMKIKEIEQQLKDEAEDKAREVISTAIQRCAADHAAEVTVSVVALPNDEMKGRIIGREGRNIRTLETITGVDLIIDDTPEAITLSSFDPMRREVARLTIEKLITDGRIHPSRIEEMYEKSKREVDATIKSTGERAAIEAGVNGINGELIKLLGRLKYRTSYGQNVLNHALEVSYIAGLMAAEIGADVKQAKRAGLLHDIGKALTLSLIHI